MKFCTNDESTSHLFRQKLIIFLLKVAYSFSRK